MKSNKHKGPYVSPTVVHAVRVELENCLLAASVIEQVDNIGQDVDGWYEEIDEWS